MLPTLITLANDDAGAGLSEYALLVAMVALTVFMVVRMIGHELKTLYSSSANSI